MATDKTNNKDSHLQEVDEATPNELNSNILGGAAAAQGLPDNNEQADLELARKSGPYVPKEGLDTTVDTGSRIAGPFSKAIKEEE